jgi:hypothetical protein
VGKLRGSHKAYCLRPLSSVGPACPFSACFGRNDHLNMPVCVIRFSGIDLRERPVDHQGTWIPLVVDCIAHDVPQLLTEPLGDIIAFNGTTQIVSPRRSAGDMVSAV